MQLTSLGFLLFVLIGLILYYLLPKKVQPVILLFMSMFFYCSYDVRMVLYILCTMLTTFFAAKKIEELDRKDSNRKKILQLTLFFNFGLLAFVKYTEFVLGNLSGIADYLHVDLTIPGIQILAPIGISFYTFQATGYILDVYWKKDRAEIIFWKYALFVSFFPQIIQGPISKHKQLSNELFLPHSLNTENIEAGMLLILWGFFKKMIIADTMAVAVSSVYDTNSYYGIAVIAGVLCYCAQLYCDFSGGIDVIRGVARLFAIEMVDNFRQPFFSKSISEFWRRWHITLGIWMKDYVFYPISLSKWMTKFGGKCRGWFGNKTGRKLPVCVANIIVFLLVGVWHGPNWNFIVYGLYNGLIIAISSLLTPVYDRLYNITKISKDSIFMHIFQIARTFVLVNIGWYFDRAVSLSHAVDLMRRTFVGGGTLVVDNAFLGLYKYQYAYVFLALVIVFIVGVMHEKGIVIHKWMKMKPLVVQYAIWLVLIFAIPIMGFYSPNSNIVGGFMYANF